MAKYNTFRFVTPVGIAVFPKLSKPDTHGKFADNKFKTDVDFGDEFPKLEKMINEKAKEWGYEDQQLPIVVEKDKEKKKTGRKLLRFKSKNRPAVFDAKKMAIPQGKEGNAEIAGGTKLRIDATLFSYDEGKGGLGLRLGPVQIIELVERDPNDARNFDEVEGFEYEGGDQDEDNADESSNFDDL